MPPTRHHHLSREEIRARAVAEVDRIAPSLRRFWGWLLPRMPLYSVASQNIRTRAPARFSGRLRLDDAITCPWIAVNSDRCVLALCVDVDPADGRELVDRLPPGCPKPMLVIDHWSGSWRNA